MRLAQLEHSRHGRRLAVVEGDRLRVLASNRTAYQLAIAAIEQGAKLADLVAADRGNEQFEYDAIYRGESDWKILTAFDHPEDPAFCLVSGTGLTHKASAENRSKMHQPEPSAITDSMRMYQWGIEGGKPPKGAVGVQPEWFYKGNGSILRAHGEELTLPAFGDDGGEEPEVAGAYLIAPDGTPYLVGLMTGNEFSDHVMERKNYLYLAPSKLRECAIGPELIVGEEFEEIDGKVSVERNGATLWSKEILTGQRNMSHSTANLEHHHFKYPAHRRPGDVHIHFFGADAFSFGAGVALQPGDVMVVDWPPLGRPLRNILRAEAKPEAMVTVERL